MTKIELTDINGTYSIELNEDIEVIGDYIELLVRPVLLAAGFSPENIVEYLGE